MNEQNLNYYHNPYNQDSGLKYRLEADEEVLNVVHELRGGVLSRQGNKIIYNEEFRLVNELGVARIHMLLRSSINKVNHLTKYSGEERVFRQVKSIMRSFIFELTHNLKTWRPFINDKTCLKVNNKSLIIQTIENVILQSSLRATDGFEAELTGKSWNVNELAGDKPIKENNSFFGFGGGEQ